MTEPAAADDEPIIEVEDFSFFYGSKQVLFNIGMTFETNRVTALIGPSGCGKSTLLRNINRMNDLVPDVHHQGDIRIDGTSLYDPRVEVISLRKRVGMVFQKYNPFPKSIYENIVFPLRVAGRNRRAELDETVERSLKGAALWDEVKDKLHESAYGLSGGQQQRLCIARAIANRPQILLMDEPCAALDPIATLKIEDLMEDLKKELTIVIVTHNMQQATRIADRTAFMYMGRLVEYGETSQIFTNPTEKETEAYITGRDPLQEETRQVLSLCSSVLTQFHPLGRDLRLVITFSRCGDKLQECMEEVTGIAKHAKASIRHQESLSPDIVLPLLEMAVSEFRDAARCLETQDVDAAREIRLRDKKLDKAHRKALALLVSPEREDSPSLNVNLLFIIRSLERIGDIAKTIAATVVFLKEATDIRHGKER